MQEEKQGRRGVVVAEGKEERTLGWEGWEGKGGIAMMEARWKVKMVGGRKRGGDQKMRGDGHGRS